MAQLTSGESTEASVLNVAPQPSQTRIRAGILCFRNRGPPDRELGVSPGVWDFLFVNRRSKVGRVSKFSGSAASEHEPDNYTVPAGKFETGVDESCEACALREAAEEAGIGVEIVADLGWYESRSKHDERIQTRYFLTRYVRQLESWQEEGQRERFWFSFDESERFASYRKDLSALVADGMKALTSSLLPETVSQAVFLGTSPPAAASKAEASRMEASSVEDIRLPSNEAEERYTFYGHQVGGHFCLVKPAVNSSFFVELPSSNPSREECSGKVRGGDVLLKPFQEDECNFYRVLSQKRCVALLPFMPRFFGTTTLQQEQVSNIVDRALSVAMNKQSAVGVDETHCLEIKAASWMEKWSCHNCLKYIVLEDLGSRASKPCFMDIKMGCRQRSAKYDDARRRHMATKAKRLSSSVVGFRICGMQCFEADSGKLHFEDKYWGQRVSADRMVDALATFLLRRKSEGEEEELELAEEGSAWGSLRCHLIRELLYQLSSLRSAVAESKGMRFWSSSLLIGFDASLAAPDRRQEFLESVRIRMIDFAHVCDVGNCEQDAEYLCGIDNLLLHLQAILQPSTLQKEWLLQRLVSPPDPSNHDKEEANAHQTLVSA